MAKRGKYFRWKGVSMNMPRSGPYPEISQKRKRVKIPGKIKEKFKQPRIIAIVRVFSQQTQIVLGALMAALGFTMFQVPFNIAAGGVTGIGIILNHFIPVPVGITVLALNIPLMVIGYFFLGRWRFVVSTVMAVFCFSLSVDFFNIFLPKVNDSWPITEDMLLASIYAGVLFGVGMGIIQRTGGTAGGSSIVARIIYEQYGFPMSQSYLFADGMIILISGLVFSWEVALLATLTLVLCGIFSDFVLEGASQVRTATIVTNKPEDVTYAILYQLQRGVSLWPVEGGHLKKSRTIVFCTVLRSRVADLKYAVTTVDPDAFIVIGVAQQVIGGYGQRIPRSLISGNDKRTPGSGQEHTTDC